MQVKGLAWAGTRTDKYQAMVRLFREELGLALDHEATEFAGFRLPSGGKVEVFGPSDQDHVHFDSGPLVGFQVDDVAAARKQLEATGMVQFIGSRQS